MLPKAIQDQIAAVQALKEKADASKEAEDKALATVEAASSVRDAAMAEAYKDAAELQVAENQLYETLQKHFRPGG